MNNHTLGAIALVCAPAMLLEALVTTGDTIPLLMGTCSMIFMAGSFCSHVGLWRAGATGHSRWGRAVLAIQLLLVALAFAFGLFEAAGLLGEENIIFIVTDMAWPLSMLWMLAVGITTAVVGRLPGWRRFVPLLCGMALPASVGIGLVAGIDLQTRVMGLIFFGMLAVFWGLLGFVVRQSGDVVVPSPGPMHGSPNAVQ